MRPLSSRARPPQMPAPTRVSRRTPPVPLRAPEPS
jgi:hypothetical protein